MNKYIFLILIIFISVTYVKPCIENYYSFNPIKEIQKIGKIFKSTFGVMNDSFKLMKTAIDMMIEISQVLYLVLDKAVKCYNGSYNVYLRMLREILINLFAAQTSIKNMNKCLSINYISKGNYYNNCIKPMIQYQKTMIDSFKKLKQIFDEPMLFALIKKSKYGYSKEYCKKKLNNKKVSGTFDYSKNCNQCFNWDGLVAKGYSQLLDVEKLIKISQKLFKKMAKLTKLLT